MQTKLKMKVLDFTCTYHLFYQQISLIKTSLILMC